MGERTRWRGCRGIGVARDVGGRDVGMRGGMTVTIAVDRDMGIDVGGSYVGWSE